MANIIPKLNLNKTPNLVENNSLVFAKNIRLDVDGTIHRDYGILPLSFKKDTESDYLIDYENLLNRIIKDIDTSIFNDIKTDLENLINPNIANRAYKIVGIIPDSNNFYIFFYGKYKENDTFKYINAIIKFNEIEDKFSICNCAWKWSGGTITGNVINNLAGDTILNIGESNTNNLTPFKSINLNKSSIHDDESIYTQTPKIPITNLLYVDDLAYTIPNGVYQFFVRYEIRKDFYTNWFPASTELFVGNNNSIDTSFGTLMFANTHRDSDNSFVLRVEHLLEDNKKNYKSFQIGFILSHDDTNYARAWKHFDLNTDIINFDYNAEDSIEIEITDLLNITYGLYDVSNITSFKNRLYISNYTESNFNDESLQEYADKIEIELKSQTGSNTYSNYIVIDHNIKNQHTISGIIVDGNKKYFSENNSSEDTSNSSIFYKLWNDSNDVYKTSIKTIVKDITDNKLAGLGQITSKNYDIGISATFEQLNEIHNRLNSTIFAPVTQGTNKRSYEVIYNNNKDVTLNIKKIIINDKEINNVSNYYSEILPLYKKGIKHFKITTATSNLNDFNINIIKSFIKPEFQGECIDEYYRSVAK